MNLLTSNLIGKAILSTALVGALAVPAFARTQSQARSFAPSAPGHVKVAKPQSGTKAEPKLKSATKPQRPKMSSTARKTPAIGKKMMSKKASGKQSGKTAKLRKPARRHQAGTSRTRHQKRKPKV